MKTRRDEHGNTLFCVLLGRRRYEVCRAQDATVLRISFVNAVRGKVPLDLSGRVAREVLRTLQAG